MVLTIFEIFIKGTKQIRANVKLFKLCNTITHFLTGRLFTKKITSIWKQHPNDTKEVNIPVKFVGLGEREDQIEAFDIEKYIYGLFKDL